MAAKNSEGYSNDKANNSDMVSKFQFARMICLNDQCNYLSNGRSWADAFSYQVSCRDRGFMLLGIKLKSFKNVTPR